jgi:hypothetical protein
LYKLLRDDLLRGDCRFFLGRFLRGLDEAKAAQNHADQVEYKCANQVSVGDVRISFSSGEDRSRNVDNSYQPNCPQDDTNDP